MRTLSAARKSGRAMMRGPRGGAMQQAFDLGTLTTTGTTRVEFRGKAGAVFLDDAALLGEQGEPIETVVYAHNDGNEQTSMTVNGVTTSMGYDAWGRLTRRTQGAYQADYAYHYGGKLVEAVSDFPGEGTVAYDYGGDQKRRERAVTGGDTTRYRWDLGWGLLNEEDDSGNLERTYVGGLAQIDGDDAATGDYAFYLTDHLGSTRGLYDSAKARVGDYQFSPYGSVYAASAFAAAAQQYTGHHWDTASALYFAPYRYYSPAMARWLTRDPLGMVDGPNVYAYVRGNPALNVDRLGLWHGPVEWPRVERGRRGKGASNPNWRDEPTIEDCNVQYTFCHSKCYAQRLCLDGVNEAAKKKAQAYCYGRGAFSGLEWLNCCLDHVNRAYNEMAEINKNTHKQCKGACFRNYEACRDGVRGRL